MMLFLADFFGVRDVSWVSINLLTGFKGLLVVSTEQTTRKHDGVATALCRRADVATPPKRLDIARRLQHSHDGF
jgi:hypothetical protein